MSWDPFLKYAKSLIISYGIQKYFTYTWGISEHIFKFIMR